MQQMNPEEVSSRRPDVYGAYEGVPPHEDHFSGVYGQKLNDDADERFADMLARKVKEQIQDEIQVPSGPSTGQQLALAIVSICVLGLVLITLIAALANSHLDTSASVALGYGMVFFCIALMVINGVFNSNGRRSNQARYQRRYGQRTNDNSNNN